MLPWAAAALACAPLLRGFPRGHDWSFELVRVAEFGRAFAGGQWPPAWAENLYGGYGSPIFLFYAPLYAAVSSGLATLVGSVPLGSLLAILVFAGAGTAAMLRMGRLAAGSEGEVAREAGRIAACLFVLHPYLICDALLRNANAEYAALCLSPIAMTGLLELSRDRVRGVLWLSGGLGLLIVAHNLTALFTAGALLVGGAALYATRRSLWTPLVAGLALGVAMAAFFWLPALTLTPLVRTTDLLTGKFDFHGQFSAVGELFGYATFFGAGVLPLVVLGAGGMLVRRSGERLLPVVLAAAGLTTLLMLRITTPIWEVVPGLAFFQFPWRLQGPLALFTCGVGALAYAAWARGQPRSRRRIVQLVVMLLAVANAAPHLLAARPFPPQQRAALDLAVATESVRRGSNQATVRDEYLPRVAALGTWRNQPLGRGGVVALEGRARIEVIEDSGTDLHLRVQAQDGTRIRLGRWAFPGWSLIVDGAERPLRPNRFGSVDVKLTPGEHTVELRFRAPVVRRAGIAVSLVSLLLFAALLVRSRRLA